MEGCNMYSTSTLQNKLVHVNTAISAVLVNYNYN